MAKEYDNSAFYYFVISILGLYAVPMSLYMVYRIYQSLLTKDKTTVKVRRQLRRPRAAPRAEPRPPVCSRTASAGSFRRGRRRRPRSLRN